MDFFVGIDLGGTALKVGITDASGNIQTKKSFVTVASENADTLVDHFANCIRETIQASNLNKKRIKGAGIGSPGLLNPETGQLHVVSNLPMLNEFFLAPALQKRIGIPVFLDNDVNAMALGEFYFGAAKGYKNIIAITLGTGIGGGLIINGQLYQGASFTAGEIGHISIETNGVLCNCGTYGCIEKYASRDGIINRFKAYYYKKEMKSSIENHLDNGAITPKAIAMAAEAGDSLSQLVLREVGGFLGIALATYVNILNPELIVIGGGIANAGELLLGPAREEMIKRACTVPARAVSIVQAKLRNDAGLIGAASIAVAKLA